VDEDFVDPTITRSPATESCAFIGGFIAGEGCFTRHDRRARFAVALGATDVEMLRLIKRTLGVGFINHYARRKSHFDDVAIFAVSNQQDLVRVIVPFMDVWLPPSYKREQYLAWRAQLLEQHGNS